MNSQSKHDRSATAELNALRARVAELEAEQATWQHTQEELARHKAILTAAIESLPFDVYALDPQGRCILQNAVSRAYYGDALGKTAEQICTDPGILARWLGKHERVLAGERVEGEVELPLPDGPHYLYSVLAPIQAEDRLYGLLGVNMDITARKRAEESLRASEHRYRALAESTRDIIYVVDASGAVVYANRAAVQCIGIPHPDIVGKGQTDLFPPDMAESHFAKIRHVMNTGNILEEDELFQFGPNQVWLRVHLIPLYDDAGRIESVMGVCHNITDRKRGEQVLQQAHDDLEKRAEVAARKSEESLRQSERRFRNYFEQGLVGMAATAVDHRWLEVNDRLCEILGYSRDELTRTAWTEITFPDDLGTDLEKFDDLLAGRIEHYTMDKRFVRKDGAVVYTLMHVRALRGDDGAVDHIVGILEDITDRKLAEAALERERHSLWRMLQASDHERRMISYEIHDGLAQYLAAAGMQFQRFEAVRDNSPAKARTAYETAVELVRQSYLEVRRLISEVRPPVIDEIGLETAISHLVHEQRQHGGTEIHFDSSVRIGRLPAMLENALYRIVQEALTNACRHSQSPRVAVTLRQEGQEMRLKIEDWGIGFDPVAVERGHFGLEGIRQRVRLLGGRLSIESTPGAGTVIQVSVPIVEASVEHQAEPEELP